MVQRILIWHQEYRNSSLKPNYGSSPRHVIGKDLLEEIWADMKRTVLPNWIQPPPSQWGTSASGKLSADEYKVICSISLVITLIRVWGYKNDEGVESRRFKMLENFLDLVHSMRVLFFRETSQKSRAYYKSHILKYLRGVLELYPDFTLKPNHHHAVHVVTDLETMGPGHAHSTPVFERINHSLQQLNTNRRLGEVETTMLTSYCREANLQVILDHNTDLQGEINEAITALTDIDREDHRGIFAGTDLVAWASTEFKASPACIAESTLDCIIYHLCNIYGVSSSHWDGKVSRQVNTVGGVAAGRVIYSPAIHQNSVVFRNNGRVCAGTIEQVINHSHPHPVTRKMISITYLKVIIMEPIDVDDDLYRRLDCGWLCYQNPGAATKNLTVPLSHIVSHFVRTDLSFRIRGKSITHVYPVPKFFHDNDSGMPAPVD
ncbi:hypothetical protein EV359DRAFT_85892 [Lentinula novae-zelandiae]|nr:hypothetical protein EV359DRAFT_85892 [Lentinula novae-zelandiae]